MEEKIKMEDEFSQEESDVLTLEDLNSGFIGNPKVGGDAVAFTVKTVKKLKGDNAKGKTKEGKVFSKTLSGDNVDYGFEVLTASNDRYTVPGWEVWGKLKSIFGKLQKFEGVKIKITHLLDGMKAENKKLDKYKVEAFVDGAFRTLDRTTKEWSN